MKQQKDQILQLNVLPRGAAKARETKITTESTRRDKEDCYRSAHVIKGYTSFQTAQGRGANRKKHV